MSTGSTAGGTTSGIGRRFSRETQQLTRIRRFVRSWLGEQGVDDDVVDAFELAVSELATNAIQHGSGDEIDIQLSAARDGLVAIVAADSERVGDIGAVDSWRIAPPEAISGRGLGIVAAVMDSIEFSGDGGRAVFRCRRRR
jgi:anti-sigma regulatory factor (Ser/Thr protein kinase)